MARNVTVTFDDGSTHVYQGVPDTATPDQVEARAAQDFSGRKVTGLDGGAGSPPAPPPASPPSGGILDQTGDFFSALGHHVMKPLHGAAQLVENTIASGASKLPDNPISRYLVSTAQADNQAAAQNEQQYQKTTANSPGAYAGATVGEVAPFLVGGAASKLNEAGDYVASKAAGLVPTWMRTASPAASKLASRVTSGAAQGAVVSVVAPVTDQAAPTLSSLVSPDTPAAPNYWDSKIKQVEGGALVGGSIPAGTSLIGAVARGVKDAAAPIVNPSSIVAPALAKWATAGGDTLPNVIGKLRGNNELVPGSLPTTAQVIANPTIAAAEKVTAGNPLNKAAFDARNVDNNNARIAALTDAKGDPGAPAAMGGPAVPSDLENAIGARAAATQPLIDKLLTNPTTSQPIRAASILSKIDQLDNSSFSTDPVIAKTLAALRKQVSDAADKTDVNAYTYTPAQLASLKNEPYVRADLLDGIRQNLRGTISDNASNGAVSSKQEAGLQPLADHIASAIDSVNPGYRNYLATYAKSSAPINGMEAAGRVLDDVAGPGRGVNSAGVPQVTLPGFSAALARAQKKAPYGLPADTQGTLDAVQADLQRAGISNAVRSPGSDTSYNLQAPGWIGKQLYGDNLEGKRTAATALGGVLGGAVGLIGGGAGATAGATAGAALANKLTAVGQRKVNDLVSQALLDPSKAADLLDELTKQVGPSKARAALAQISAAVPQLAAPIAQFSAPNLIGARRVAVPN